MKTHWLGVAMMLGCLLMAGCPPTGSTGPEADHSATGDQTTTMTGSGHLSQLIEAARVKIYAAENQDEFAAILDTLARELAADSTISDNALRQEKERMDSLNARLHSGEMRVYPDERTSAFIFGVPAAISQALEIRAGGRSKP